MITMTRLHIITMPCLLLASPACQQRKQDEVVETRVRLSPMTVTQPVLRQPGMRESQDLSRVGFLIETGWTSGPIEMRFPEVLRSDAGFHFLDHYVSAITPLAEWKQFPQWRSDPQSGGLSYDFKTPDGLRLIASAIPAGDEVKMEFTVINESSGPLNNVEANCCLTFGSCPELNDARNPAMIHAVLDGRFQSLDHATPTPSEMGRDPWFLIVRDESTVLPKVSPTWWRIDQHHTENLMAATTRDGKYLVGYTWDREPVGLMSNVNNPCLHTGMGASPEIPPGGSFTWRGKIYLLPNTPDELLRRYHNDQSAWKKPSTPSTP